MTYAAPSAFARSSKSEPALEANPGFRGIRGLNQRVSLGFGEKGPISRDAAPEWALHHLTMHVFARRHAPIAAALAFNVFALSVVVLLPTRQAVLTSNLGQCLAPALAALACLWASRRAARADHERAWRFLAGSALSWSLGQVVWTGYEITGAAAPFPSLADVGYLLAVPLALVGVLLMSDRSTVRTRTVGVLDGLIVASALLAISWPVALGPSWNAGGNSPYTFALSLAYPIGTLAVASSVLLAIMRTRAQSSTVPLWTIAAGLLVLASADSIFVWSTLQGTEQQVSPADLHP